MAKVLIIAGQIALLVCAFIGSGLLALLSIYCWDMFYQRTKKAKEVWDFIRSNFDDFKRFRREVEKKSSHDNSN